MHQPVLLYLLLQSISYNTCRKREKKVCCLGLTSILALSEAWLSEEAFGVVLKAIIELLVTYKDQVAGLLSL